MITRISKRVSPHLRIVFALVTLISVSHAFSNPICPEKYDHFAPVEGGAPNFRLSNNLRALLPPGAHVRELGSGGGGGTVFRINEVNGAEYSLKEFRSESSMQKDLLGFALLKKAFAQMDDASPARSHFDLVSALPMGNQILKLNYVRGATLKSLLAADSPLSLEKQNQLEIRYQTYLEDLRRTLAISDDAHNPAVFEVPVAGSREPIFLYLKTENILVDPQTLHLTIIDPR